MLLANDTAVTYSETNAPIVVSINGETGIYRHAHGQTTATSFGNNTDFKIEITY